MGILVVALFESAGFTLLRVTGYNAYFYRGRWTIEINASGIWVFEDPFVVGTSTLNANYPSLSAGFPLRIKIPTPPSKPLANVKYDFGQSDSSKDFDFAGIHWSADRNVGIRISSALLVSLFGALSVVSFILLWRFCRRTRVGFCDRCGYDLRASNERCPECGEAIPRIHCSISEATRTLTSAASQRRCKSRWGRSSCPGNSRHCAS
jgi:hypothetical protein